MRAARPCRNGTTLQLHAYPQPGRPTKTGTGTGKGSPRASTGNHFCSCSTSDAAVARRGSRANRSVPRRTSTLSHPLPRAERGSAARSGRCSRSNRPTRSASTSTSALGMLRTMVDSRPTLPCRHGAAPACQSGKASLAWPAWAFSATGSPVRRCSSGTASSGGGGCVRLAPSGRKPYSREHPVGGERASGFWRRRGRRFAEVGLRCGRIPRRSWAWNGP
jgi:hypothetical protein